MKRYPCFRNGENVLMNIIGFDPKRNKISRKFLKEKILKWYQRAPDSEALEEQRGIWQSRNR